MERIRSDAWKEDNNLKTTLQEYVRRRYKRSEIIVSVKKQFPQYSQAASGGKNEFYLQVVWTF